MPFMMIILQHNNLTFCCKFFILNTNLIFQQLLISSINDSIGDYQLIDDFYLNKAN